MLTSQMAALRNSDECVDGPAERRRHRRLTMAGRAARLDAPADIGLCSVVNLSDGGILVETPIELDCGDPVRISFDCTNSVQGQVAWRIGRRAGIRFLIPVASFALIGKVANDRWDRVARPPRLTLNQQALVTSGSGSFATVVADISQQGMSLQHAGQLTQGLAVELAISGGAPIRGTVKWTDQSLAGVEMDGKLTVEQLSSRRGLEFSGSEPARLSGHSRASKWTL